jgi:hypothetical protein
VWRRRATEAVFLALLAGAAHGQNCPPVDPEQQKTKEQECRASGGEWSRFGVHDHLCGIYSCAERTNDAGKPCRDRADCEHLCVTDSSPKVGAEVTGHCTAVKTSFGCFTHVDGGRIVGRACMD